MEKNYSCDVLYDVIEMDICHIIMGHPWQFHKGVWFNWQAITYIAKWKGKKLWLVQNDSTSKNFDQDKSIFLSVLKLKVLQ